MIRRIRSDLKRQAEKTYREGAERYFQGTITLYGVRSFKVRRTSARYYKLVKDLAKREIFDLGGELLQSGYAEENMIAFDWAYRLRKKYETRDFKVFESWLRKYVANWGSCDDFCRHAFGAFVYRYPEFLDKVMKWTRSRNRWLKRGAGVIMIYSLHRGEHLDVAFRIANMLLDDDDYLVQNGYGWMLKEASIRFPGDVFKYVVQHQKMMPRRALRYAIERFPPEKRRVAMA
jgi:3-methyladenine DNA glycosylase AlkD